MRSGVSRAFLIILLIIAIATIVALWMEGDVSLSTPIATTATTTLATSTASVATTTATSTEPLDTQVVVNSPVASSTVATTFTVSGSAPSGWYFEAVFPIQVRDPDDNLVAQGQGQAQSDWTAPGPIPFTSSPIVVENYSGPATLILLKDNPSGLPQNDDEVSIPIVIQ